jgi:hypothetical protein
MLILLGLMPDFGSKYIPTPPPISRIKPKENVMNVKEAHLERMVVEKVELEEKVKKLLDFVNTPIYQELDEQTKGLLAIQGRAMQTYLECLQLRIKLS